MILHNTPFRDFDQLFGRIGALNDAPSRPMPMDAYRRDGNVWVHIDLPGVNSDSIDINVERSVLTVTAERTWNRQDDDRAYLTERPSGVFQRQVHLGESLDTEGIEADFTDGVLTLRVPISETAKARKIEVNAGVNTSAIETSSS